MHVTLLHLDMCFWSRQRHDYDRICAFQAAADQASALLDGVQLFTLPDKLLSQNHPQPLPAAIISFATTASKLGAAFTQYVASIFSCTMSLV